METCDDSDRPLFPTMRLRFPSHCSLLAGLLLAALPLSAQIPGLQMSKPAPVPAETQEASDARAQEWFKDAKTAAIWKEIDERLASRTMPPSAKPQPTAEELKTLAGWLDDRLVAADRARRKVEGRALLRRLNRTEYENTVRDLFAINIDLKHLLPEDEAVDGFDNPQPQAIQ